MGSAGETVLQRKLQASQWLFQQGHHWLNRYTIVRRFMFVRKRLHSHVSRAENTEPPMDQSLHSLWQQPDGYPGKAYQLYVLMKDCIHLQSQIEPVTQLADLPCPEHGAQNCPG